MYKGESSFFFEKKNMPVKTYIRMPKCGNNKFDPEKSNILPIFLLDKFAKLKLSTVYVSGGTYLHIGGYLKISSS